MKGQNFCSNRKVRISVRKKCLEFFVRIEKIEFLKTFFKYFCVLSQVATYVFKVRLLHAFVFSKKLLWFKPTYAICLENAKRTLKTLVATSLINNKSQSKYFKA